MRMHDTEAGTVDEDWDVLLSFLPRDWRELARDTGALKGLRKDKTVDNLLRTLLLHLGCGHSSLETVVRARQARLADLSDVALLKRLKKSKVQESANRELTRSAASRLRSRIRKLPCAFSRKVNRPRVEHFIEHPGSSKANHIRRMRKARVVTTKQDVDGHAGDMSCDYTNVSVVGDQRQALSATCFVFSLLSMPRYTLPSTPCQVLSSGGMRWGLDIRPQARREPANATGIHFGPNHGEPVTSSDSRDQVERLGIGRCIDQ